MHLHLRDHLFSMEGTWVSEHGNNFNNLDLRVERSPEWKTTPSLTSGVRNGFNILNTMLKTLKSWDSI